MEKQDHFNSDIFKHEAIEALEDKKKYSESEDTVSNSLTEKLPRNFVSNNYSDHEKSVFLQFYLCAVIFCNLLLLFFEGHNGDIGFWQNWVEQLATKGYADFNGNYPPIYIHWLYALGQFYTFFDIPIENNIYLKFLTQTPVLFSHLIITGVIFDLLKRYSCNKFHFHSVMLMATMNPAILFNGPIWGQMDVIPLIPLLAALLISFKPKWRVFCIPLYTVALLTKFQMIAFAPVFGIIFFRHIKIHLIGIALSLLAVVIAFLPSMISGSVLSAFKYAYIDVLKQYGLTTMGASNIWILLTGNAAPDHIVLFNVDPQSSIAVFFTAKYFGITLFFLVCLCVFLKGINKTINHDNPRYVAKQISETLFYALICSTAFFTLLPAMHERYLLPAVIISLAYYVVTPNKIIYPLAVSFLSAFNLAMALGVKTFTIWSSISWIVLALFLYFFLELLVGENWNTLTKTAFRKIAQVKYLAFWFWILGTSCVFFYLHEKNQIHTPVLGPNQLLLTDLTPVFSHQDFGKLQIHKNINGAPLSAGGTRYAYGLGTHANSQIDYVLPPNTTRLTFLAGLDDHIESAEVRFLIRGDGKLIWESPPQYGFERNLQITEINLVGIKRLSLTVLGMRSIDNDHANWINPILLLDNKTGHHMNLAAH